MAKKTEIPTVNNATLTIQKNGTNVQTFTSNQGTNVTANITVPTKTSDLTNDSGFLTSHQSLANYVNTVSQGTGSVVTSVTKSGNTINVTRGDVPTHSHSGYLSSITAGTNISVIGSTVSVVNAPSFSGRVTALEFYEQSDRRLKENINNISDAEKINSIDLKEYNFKSDENKIKKYGVIAQELEDAGLEHLVQTNENGMKSVDYISTLVLAVQALREEVKNLKDEIAELKK